MIIDLQVTACNNGSVSVYRSFIFQENWNSPACVCHFLVKWSGCRLHEDNLLYRCRSPPGMTINFTPWNWRPHRTDELAAQPGSLCWNHSDHLSIYLLARVGSDGWHDLHENASKRRMCCFILLAALSWNPKSRYNGAFVADDSFCPLIYRRQE